MGVNLSKDVSVVLIGDGSVGKTSFCDRIKSNDKVYKFNKEYIASDGVNLHKVKLNTQRGSANVYLWDTAGQEKFGSLRSGFVKPADVVILLYDVTEPNTKNNVTSWLKYINENCESTVPVIVCGNKIDKNKRANPYRLASLQTLYKGPIESTLISVRTGDGVTETLNWLLSKHYNGEILINKS